MKLTWLAKPISAAAWARARSVSKAAKGSRSRASCGMDILTTTSTEIRNPKAEIRKKSEKTQMQMGTQYSSPVHQIALDDNIYPNSSFWVWGDENSLRTESLREEPAQAKPVPRDLMERVSK